MFFLEFSCVFYDPSVRFSSVAQLCPTLCRPHESQHARPPYPSPSPRVHSDSHPSSRWCYPAISSSVVPFSSCPRSFPASGFSSESALCIRWPKCWSFSFSISPSYEYSGLIFFRIDWFDLRAVEGTVKSLLQHHSGIHHHVWNRQLGRSCSVTQGAQPPAPWQPRGVGWGVEVGGRLRGQGTCVYLWSIHARGQGTCVYSWSIHVVVWQKPTRCKAMILQLEVNFKKE